MQTRMGWIRALKPGDRVLDCRDQVRRIVKIEDEIETQNDCLAVSSWILAMFCLPLAAKFQEITQASFATVVVERIVYFADGSSCRATHCLDPIPRNND